MTSHSPSPCPLRVLRASVVSIVVSLLVLTAAEPPALAQAAQALAQGDQQRARELLESWRGDDHPMRQLLLGNLALAAERHQDAAVHFQASLALSPDQPELALSLARLQLSLGQPAEALALFTAHRRAISQAADAYAYALAAFELEDAPLAAAIVAQARLDYPQHRELQRLELVLLLGEERHHAAAEAARRLLRQSAGEPEDWALLARSLAQAGQWSGALAAWEAALERDPQQSAQRRGAVEAALQLGLGARALDWAATLAEAGPGPDLALALRAAEAAADAPRLAAWLALWPEAERPREIRLLALRQAARSDEPAALRQALAQALALEDEPADRHLLLWAASLDEDAGDVTRAELLYRRAAEDSDAAPARLAQLRLVALLLRQERLAEAQALLATYAQRHPGDEAVAPLQRYLEARGAAAR